MCPTSTGQLINADLAEIVDKTVVQYRGFDEGLQHFRPQLISQITDAEYAVCLQW